MSRLALLLLVAAGLGACASANGYDPSRYTAAPEPLFDPEIEPLKPSPKRRMRDPRGVPVFDAGALVATAPPAEAGAMQVARAGALVDAGATVGPACGSKATPCPMQRFMHGTMETAHTADTLTSGFTLVAGMSPDPEWAWVAIATRGADLANAAEIARAKAQCTACHDSYRERYRARYRGRPL